MEQDTNQTSINKEIEQVMARVESNFRNSEPASKDHPKSDPLEFEGPDWRSRLRRADYPQRHIDAIPKMKGPSLEKAKEILPKVLSGDCLLLLVGERGPGKTQMATWLGYQLILARKSCGYYTKAFDLFSDIKATWIDKSHGREEDVLRKYQKAAFLVIDEAHEQGDSEWAQRTMVNIIDHRYDDMLATIFIANLPPEKVEDAVGSSIYSRAKETGGLVKCNWPSYR